MEKINKIIIAISGVVLVASLAVIVWVNNDTFAQTQHAQLASVAHSVPGEGLVTVSAARFAEKYTKQKASDSTVVLLDVRTLQEYNAGHYEGAEMLDFYQNDFRQKLMLLDKNATYYIYCRSGNRSGQALTLMHRLGFENVFDLGGGISQAGAVLPIVQSI